MRCTKPLQLSIRESIDLQLLYLLYNLPHERRDLRRIFGDDPDGKITRLLDWTERPGDVADPWYTGNFDATYRDVLDGCTAMLEQL